VRGLFLPAKYCVPPMQARGGGAIVVVASDASFVAVGPQVPYCTSKGAALQFTRSLAVDLWDDHIRVNCVCPSGVDTPMLRRALGGALDRSQPGFEAIATAEQVAAQVLFLASDDAATVNGTFLLADWGGMARSTWPI
jgi:dihydroanticapsin dehydrogenase